MKNMHLICNAHLDPVWQWNREEGIGAAISTFRTAVEICESEDGFVFNHNEAVLYQWIEEYAPELFQRICSLVEKGRWHIMGGWYLQPDCTMPSGESITRQMLTGLYYFKQKFGKRPTTAINFDSFGHSRGLVQLLQKAGYTGYFVVRPGEHELSLDKEYFTWEGFAGSRVTVQRMPAYNTFLGKSADAIRERIRTTAEEPVQVMLWGVGNHGGGPSRLDVEKIRELADSSRDIRLLHSTPEAYFDELKEKNPVLPVVKTSLVHTMPGCYTSMIRLKQMHRTLENQLVLAEKMASHASAAGRMEYPRDALEAAWKDLLFAEFHDILPGSSIQPVEEYALQLMGHGIEETRRIKEKAFFLLSGGQILAKPGELPVLVYNPLPYPVETTVDCEFMLADQNRNIEFSNPLVYQGEMLLCSQPEKEYSNIPIDWRKRVVFHARLEACSMNRFDIRLEILPQKPAVSLKSRDGRFTMATKYYTAVVNERSGLLESYKVDGVEFLKPEGCRLAAIRDNEDPWGMTVKEFRDVKGYFASTNPKDTAEIAGIPGAVGLERVRVIEDGDVRTVMEWIGRYEESAVVVRYFFSKVENQIGIEIRLLTLAKDTMFKFFVPTSFSFPVCTAKTMFGMDPIATTGIEAVSQEYFLAQENGFALSVISDGTYGVSVEQNEVRLSLLRTSGYCCHPVDDRQILPQDRFTGRFDQGERIFHFYLSASRVQTRLKQVELEAQRIIQSPMAICYFPLGEGCTVPKLCEIGNPVIVLSAFKQAENGNGYILRLFNSCEEPMTTSLAIPILGLVKDNIEFRPYEVLTFRAASGEGEITETSLLEDL